MTAAFIKAASPVVRICAAFLNPADRDRRAQPVDQIEQRVRPRGETVVHLASEPVKFTLVSTTAPAHTMTTAT